MAEASKAAAPRVEKTRSTFRSLIAGNPNYFGSLPDSDLKIVKAMASNTSYEALTSVGYNPATRRLYATFEVKKAGGYGGDLCDDGSTEYVRFFVDHGSGWVDVGLVATDVHDIPSGKDCANRDRHPLVESLEHPYDPPRKWCTTPQLPNLRAILSWNVAPPAGNPNFIPAYGNVMECHIQIDKSWWWVDFLDEIKTKVKLPDDLLETIEIPFPPFDPQVPDIPDLPEPPFPGPHPSPAAKVLELEDLIDVYTVGDKRPRLDVEPERFAFATLQVAAGHSEALAALKSSFDKIKIELADVVGLIEDTTGNISYEELIDLGLESNREKLVATYHIKKQSGFSGSLCTNGSIEYVAFWADWDDSCTWEYLGTVAVKAYDFPQLPSGGLCYSAALPVDLDEFKRRCSDPRVARVRAVLSWNSPPSTTNPDQVPTWGNRLDAHVLIPRKEGEPGQLTIIGGISTEFISDVTGLVAGNAKFADTGISIYSPLGLECPFGGLVVVRGPAVTGKRYRLQVIDSVGGSVTLTEKIWVTPVIGFSSYHSGSADGWFNYLPYTQNFAGILGYYRSNGSDKVTIQLEIEGEGVVDTQVIQLDNTAPTGAISITQPGSDCGVFDEGDELGGKVWANDTYMGGWSVSIDGGPAGFGPVNVTSGNANTPIAGTNWTFDTNGMDECGYVVEVHVQDRAIVNSGNHQHHFSTDVGFCLD
jgi:hypothetical protein